MCLRCGHVDQAALQRRGLQRDREHLRAVARHAGGTATSAESVKGERPARAIIGAHRDLFLRYELASAEWRLVTSEDRALALAPASSVTTSLCLLFALAMVSAFAFAHQQIRRSTQPLEALRDATRRVEAGDLDTPVVISSRDEYGELGVAFNGMTNTLSRQLTLLRLMDDVDEATRATVKLRRLQRSRWAGCETHAA